MKRLSVTIAFIVAAVSGVSPVFAQNPARTSYVELVGIGTQRFSDNGWYFCAMSQTPGTAYNLSAAAQSSFLATQALWTLKNTSATATGTRIYPQLAKIVYATGGTAGTRVEVAVALDDVTRYSSGGTAVSIKNVNMDTTTAPLTVATVNAGDITAAAAGANVRYVARSTLSTAIPGAGETFTIDFGFPFSQPITAKGASLPPVVIGPGQSMVIHEWSPSQSATPTGELLLCWVER